MPKYLSSEGLAYLWSRIKEYLPEYVGYISDVYKPINYNYNKIDIPSNQYVQSAEIISDKMYVFTSLNDKTAGYVYKVDLATMAVESTKELATAAEMATNSIYFNSASAFDSTRIALVETINSNYVDFYDISADKITYRKQIASYSISNVCFTAQQSAIVVPRSSLVYHVYRPSVSGCYLKCAELDYYPAGSYLRADMCKLGTHNFGQIFGIGDSAKARPSYIVVTDMAGYHIGKILVPYISSDTEAQGLAYDAGNHTLYIIFAHGTIASFVIPEYFYSDINGITTHAVDYAPYKISGEIYTNRYNGSTPAIPYKVETAVFKDAQAIVRSGIAIRSGKMQQLVTIPSSASPEFQIYVPIYAAQKDLVPSHVLRYGMQADGTLTLNAIYDGSTSVNVTESNYANSVASLSGTIRFLYYNNEPELGLYDISNRVNYSDLVTQ